MPYLNSAPFFRGLSLGEGHELVDLVPRQLGQQAAAGEVAAGLIPLADYLRLEEVFERIGRFGIAVRGRAHSVVLFSRKPIRQLAGATIVVTEDTSTSAVLLRLLLEVRYRLTPASYRRRDAASPAMDGGDALLLIGDEALRFQKTNTRYPFEIDLAFEWWLWQHLPCVFAVWAIRRDASPQDKQSLERALTKALGMNMQQVDAIAAERAEALGLSVSEVTSYLSNFVYRLSQPEEEGIKKFRELADEHRLL